MTVSVQDFGFISHVDSTNRGLVPILGTPIFLDKDPPSVLLSISRSKCVNFTSPDVPTAAPTGLRSTFPSFGIAA